MRADELSSNSRGAPDLSAELTRGGLQVLAINFAATGLGFLSLLIVARALGLSEYGRFVYAITTVNFLLLPAVAGLDSVAVRFVASYSAGQEHSKLIGLLRWLRTRVLVNSLVTTLVCVLSLLLLGLTGRLELWSVMLIVACGISLQAFSLMRQALLRGFKQVALSVIPEGIVRPLLMIGLVAAAWLLMPDSFDALWAAVIFLVVSALTFGVGQVFVSWYRPKAGTFSKTELELELWKSLASSAFIISVANLVHSQADIWMLGTLASAELVGPYSAAAKYSLFVVFGMNAMNTMLGPMVAGAAGDRARLQQLASRAVTISFVLGAVCAVVMLLAPIFFLGLFGSGFAEAVWPLRILVAAQLLNVACGSVGMLLSMTGHHRVLMQILAASVLWDIGLNALLIPRWEMAGAAVATALSIVGWNLAALYVVRQRLQIRPSFGGMI